MTGPLIAARELGQLLRVPPGWELAALVPVGLAAEEPDMPKRRPIDRVYKRLDSLGPLADAAEPSDGTDRAAEPSRPGSRQGDG